MKTRSNGLVRDKMKMKGELVEMIVAREMKASHNMNMNKKKKRKMEENVARMRRNTTKVEK